MNCRLSADAIVPDMLAYTARLYQVVHRTWDGWVQTQNSNVHFSLLQRIDTVEKFFETHDNVFVLYCFPWFETCQDLIQLWNDFGRRIQDDETLRQQVQIVAVDCAEAFDELCVGQELYLFKTIPKSWRLRWYHKEAPSPFVLPWQLTRNPTFSVDDLVAYTRKRVGLETIELVNTSAKDLHLRVLDNTTFSPFVAQHRDVLVNFCARRIPHCIAMAPIWQSLAEQVYQNDTTRSQVQLAFVDASLPENLGLLPHHFRINPMMVRDTMNLHPLIVWYRKGKAWFDSLFDRKANAFYPCLPLNNATGSCLFDFVYRRSILSSQQDRLESASHAVVLNKTNLETFLSLHTHVFVNFCDSSVDICQSLAPIWQDVAQRIHGQRRERDSFSDVMIVTVNCTSPAHETFCRAEKRWPFSPYIQHYRRGIRVGQVGNALCLPHRIPETTECFVQAVLDSSSREIQAEPDPIIIVKEKGAHSKVIKEIIPK